MELFASYDELNAYIAEKVSKSVSVGFAEGGNLKVCYTQRMLIKTITIPVTLRFLEVGDSSLLVEYKGGMGLDMVISGALGFIKSKLPALADGITPEKGHRVRVDLTKIKKASPLVENVALRAISAEANGVSVRFSLKV